MCCLTAKMKFFCRKKIHTVLAARYQFHKFSFLYSFAGGQTGNCKLTSVSEHSDHYVQVATTQAQQTDLTADLSSAFQEFHIILDHPQLAQRPLANKGTLVLTFESAHYLPGAQEKTEKYLQRRLNPLLHCIFMLHLEAICFSCLLALTRTSSTILHRIGENKQLALFLIVMRKLFKFDY